MFFFPCIIFLVNLFSPCSCYQFAQSLPQAYPIFLFTRFFLALSAPPFFVSHQHLFYVCQLNVYLLSPSPSLCGPIFSPPPPFIFFFESHCLPPLGRLQEGGV
ncbi:hypothetical protein BC940DRAFT_293457 [Gongronella butleri]|nr:hypothetical protein BC940DRAFT_293457 [Gongronella butleri]